LTFLFFIWFFFFFLIYFNFCFEYPDLFPHLLKAKIPFAKINKIPYIENFFEPLSLREPHKTQRFLFLLETFCTYVSVFYELFEPFFHFDFIFYFFSIFVGFHFELDIWRSFFIGDFLDSFITYEVYDF